jgi:putative oxidoreductase
MRDAALLGARLTVGGYVAAHGVQKLVGAFGGHGIKGTGGFFESLGLSPGEPLARVAGASETLGGALTALGLGGPLGPAAVASTMAVATTTAHRGKGAFAATGGPELPLTNIAAVVTFAAAGFGRYSLDRLFGLRVPRTFAALAWAGGAVTAAVLARQSLREAQDQQAQDQQAQEQAAREQDAPRVAPPTAAETDAGVHGTGDATLQVSHSA